MSCAGSEVGLDVLCGSLPALVPLRGVSDDLGFVLLKPNPGLGP